MNNDLPVLTDDSIMTFGKHQGKKMANIPDKWFIWVKNNVLRHRYAIPTLDYIEDNWDSISKSIDEEDQEPEDDMFPGLGSNY